MRKLLIVIFVAAVVGIVITKVHKSSSAATQAARDAAGAMPAAGLPADAPAVFVSAPAAAPSAPGASRKAAAKAPELALKKGAPAGAQPQLLSAATVPPAATTPLVSPAPAAPPATPAATGAAPAASPAAAAVNPAAADVLAKAQALLTAGKRVEARDLLTPLYVQSTGAQAAQLRTVLDGISAELVFDPRCMDAATAYTVASGDTLVRIAKKYGINYRMIALLNGMDDKSVLRQGQKLKVLEGKPSIIVHRGEFRLDLLWNGAYVKTYSVGVGKVETPTPDGQFVVKNMVVQAPWTKPGGGILKYGDEGYPLGERWMSLDNKPGANGLGIHGTNDESSIGTKCSDGCVRLHNADVIELYDFVVAGTPVTIQE